MPHHDSNTQGDRVEDAQSLAAGRRSSRRFLSFITVIATLLCLLAYDLYPIMTLPGRTAKFHSIAALGKDWASAAAQLRQEGFTVLELPDPYTPGSFHWIAVELRERESRVEYLIHYLTRQMDLCFGMKPFWEWDYRLRENGRASIELNTSGTIISRSR